MSGFHRMRGRIVSTFAGLALAVGLTGEAAAQAYPFGGHSQPYFDKAISPSVSQAELDDATKAFYVQWKRLYLKAGCATGQYYVRANTESGAMVVSESQGYGMLIVPMMAGYDRNAQKLFDGLLAYYLAHTSSVDSRLMSGSQNRACEDIDGDDSATDGDLDAAFGLLLADKQWGSAGPIDYRKAALRIMGALYEKNVNPTTKLVNLGDWVTLSQSKYTYATRSSDWMPGHFRAFAKVDPRWRAVLDAHQRLIASMQQTYAPRTGLLPDFIVSTDTTPKPAPAGFLEGANDGQYSYNACRDPWRIGVDGLTNINGPSINAARRISTWLRGATANNPDRISDGYALNGRALVDYNSMTFVAPFAVAAMTDSSAQALLNALWARIVAAPAEGYYPDTLKLLSMLTVSRNWLNP